ncbi:MAG: phosphotransferase [Deltaproteobacteria bacterium]|nr:phosphotransferase [Deltaproteobacteria bacterium]
MELGPLLAKVYGDGFSPAEVVTLEGDASSRRYHRVHAPPGFAPATLIVMELPEDALGSDEAISGDTATELPFLNVARHLAAADLRVPAIYFDAVDDGAVLLEDLGDETFAKRVLARDPAELESWYLAAADLLTAVHDAMWPVPEGCLAETRCFDYELLRWELDHYREWGAEALFERVLDPSLRARLDKELDALAQEVESLPRGFVHRDYQSRNLMVVGQAPEPASLAIIDFQDALEGPRVYDLVALLNDSYVDVPDQTKRRVISRYAELRGLPADEISREFDLVTVQRKLKDGGRFVFIDRVKHNPSFLPYVDVSFGRVRQALTRLPGHEGLKHVLAEVDPARFG